METQLRQLEHWGLQAQGERHREEIPHAASSRHSYEPDEQSTQAKMECIGK